MISCVEVDWTVRFVKGGLPWKQEYSRDRQFIRPDCDIFHFVLNSLRLARLTQALPHCRSRELRTNPDEKFCLRRFTVAHHETLEQSVSCPAPPLESPSGIGARLATSDTGRTGVG